MKTFIVTLARSETRIVTRRIKAISEDVARDIANDMLGDIDFHDGRAVDADDWVQEIAEARGDQTK